MDPAAQCFWLGGGVPGRIRAMVMTRALALCGLLALGSLSQSIEARHSKRRAESPSLYDLKGLVDIAGEPVELSAFAGKVSLVVNVASA